MKAVILRSIDEYGDTNDRELFNYGDRYGRMSRTGLTRNRRVQAALAELLADGVIVPKGAYGYARKEKKNE